MAFTVGLQFSLCLQQIVITNQALVEVAAGHAVITAGLACVRSLIQIMPISANTGRILRINHFQAVDGAGLTVCVEKSLDLAEPSGALLDAELVIDYGTVSTVVTNILKLHLKCDKSESHTQIGKFVHYTKIGLT